MKTRIEYFEFQNNHQYRFLWISLCLAGFYMMAYLVFNQAAINNLFMLGVGAGVIVTWLVWMTLEVGREYRFMKWLETLTKQDIEDNLLDTTVSRHTKELLLLQLDRIERRNMESSPA